MRLVDIDCLPKGFIGGGEFVEGIKYVYEMLKQFQPVDAVEVVRCKDCRHFCPYEGEEHKGDCNELVGLESCVYEDDYCSYGEAKLDGKGEGDV